MKALRSMAGSLLEFVEARKGVRTVSIVNPHQDPLESYRVVTSAGSHIEIFCREITVRVAYSAWWAATKSITMYHVYCTCSAETPQRLRDLLNEDFTLARLLHPWASRVAQKKAVIDCYVDLLHSRSRLLAQAR